MNTKSERQPTLKLAVRNALRTFFPQRKKRVLKRIFQITLALIGIGTLIIAGTVAYFYQQLSPKADVYVNEKIPQDSYIYDRNGVLLYDVYDQNLVNGGRRISISLQDIPQVMQDAMVATEDKTFWTDPGVSITGTLRAAISGNGGGSTITQQVIKNLSHNTQHTKTRKFQEAILALTLTHKYSKADILDMYFNIAAFGSFDIGVESAAEVYFHLDHTCSMNGKCTPGIIRLEYNDKGQRDPILGLARASLLAVMPNAPGTIDPTLGPLAKKLALERQKVVLQAMIMQHMRVDGRPITLTMAKQAENLMAQTDFEPYQHTKRAPYFVDWVINQVALSLGNGDYAAGIMQLEHGGYIVRTTFEVNLEEYVERSIDQHINKPDYQYYPQRLRGKQILSQTLNIHSAAVVVMNAKDGEIFAMDGGADYTSTDPKVGGEYNMAAPPSSGTENPSGRPPGETMLPIDFAAAYDKRPILLAQHQNLFEDLAAASVSPSILSRLYFVAYADPTGIRTMAQKFGLMVPQKLGKKFVNGEENVSLLQMTGAYQALANHGWRVPPTGILDIYNNNGDHIYHYNTAHPPATQAIPETAAQIITSALSDELARASIVGDDQQFSFADQAAECATSSNCKYPVAIQSSGTNETEDGNTAIGYTSSLVVGTWVGNVNGSRMNSAVVGSTGAIPIWHSVIERALGWCGTQPTSSPFFLSDHTACGPAPHLQLSPSWQKIP